MFSFVYGAGHAGLKGHINDRYGSQIYVFMFIKIIFVKCGKSFMHEHLFEIVLNSFDACM